MALPSISTGMPSWNGYRRAQPLHSRWVAFGSDGISSGCLHAGQTSKSLQNSLNAVGIDAILCKQSEEQQRRCGER